MILDIGYRLSVAHGAAAQECRAALGSNVSSSFLL